MKAKDLELMLYETGKQELRYTDRDGKKQSFPVSDFTSDGTEIEEISSSSNIYSWQSIAPARYNYRSTYRLNMTLYLKSISYIYGTPPKEDPFGGWV